ncbi:MAG: calcium/proton exchanger [Microcystis aeruginosa W11-06]|nr:calcium/proton exchanger [Microcystis aeruginosa W11-03]NCR94643.1 calcium/proton exchanger [Microcystis aeruginosa W11-06]
MNIKNWIFAILLVFVPISIAGNFLHWDVTIIFLSACLAVATRSRSEIVPLAAYMGKATEEIAVVVGPNLGGLLNATFGNATELILAYAALEEGLIEVVKATITGSIIGNLLLVTGVSMFFGGLRYKEQKFQPVTARLNSSSMNLAVAAILLPTTVQYTSAAIQEMAIQRLSVAVAAVLIGVYGLSLLFSMKTHTYLYEVGDATLAQESGAAVSVKKPNLWLWVGILLLVTIGGAVATRSLREIESELLVNTLEEATSELGLTTLFTGVILLSIIGNAAEHATAVRVALKDKMDLAVSVTVGSSLQIALFVAPVLVIAGYFLGQPMALDFDPFELVAVAVAVWLANSISNDGRSNWLEGILLVATYAVITLAFFFHPAPG